MPIAMISSQSNKKKYSVIASYCLALVIIGTLFYYYITTFHSMVLSNTHVVNKEYTLSFGVGGLISSLHVQKGQLISASSVIATLDSHEYRAILKSEEAKLATLEALLPAGQPLSFNGTEPKKYELHDLIELEYDAKKSVSLASEEYAKASLDKLRKQRLADQGKITQKEYQNALNFYKQAEKKLVQSKLVFENSSTKRATVEKDYDRVRQVQKESGVDTVPLESRVKAYNAQRARVETASANLDSTSIIAPTDAKIIDVFTEVGHKVSAGQEIVYLREQSLQHTTVVGEVSTSVVDGLSYGQACEVTIPSLGSSKHAGQIIAFVPRDKNVIEVHIAVDTTGVEPNNPPKTGDIAKVTLLNE